MSGADAAPIAHDSVGEPSRQLPVWLDRVSKWYGPVIAANEISLRIEGGVTALLGANGAGKSTFMKLLTGQLRPSMGRVRVFGRSVRSPAARRRLGYCPDVDAFYEEMTGRQFVHAMVRLSGYRADEAGRRAERALTAVGMTNAEPASAWERGVDQFAPAPAGEDQAQRRLAGCSKGMRQRIKLAQAIAHEPDLLVLDEPLSGLDPVGRRDFLSLFRRLAAAGATLLISSHILDEVEELADRVLVLEQGRVVAGSRRAEAPTSSASEAGVVRLTSDRPRDWAVALAVWPCVRAIRFEGATGVELTTTDAAALCDEIARLARERELPIQSLAGAVGWADRWFPTESDKHA